MLASEDEVGDGLSFSIFWKHLRKIGTNFPVKPSDPGLFFVGKIFFHCLFNLLIHYCSVQIFYFFIIQCWLVVCF